MTPGANEDRSACWGFEDLGLMLAAILPALLVGLIVVRAARARAPSVFANEGASTLVYQSVFYATMLGALYLVIAFRHRQPFWRALRWTLPFRGAWLLLALSPRRTIERCAPCRAPD